MAWSLPDRPVRLALIVLATLGLANLILYSANWSGDPEIHIVFARNLLDGHILEFNPGDATSGETSPLYMLIVALVLLVADPVVAMFAMKLIGLLSLGWAIWCVVHAARDRATGLLVGLYCLAVPSVLFQAWLGMENMLFAACCVWIASRYVLPRQEQRPASATGYALLALIGALLPFLRPEGVVVTLALAACLGLRRQFREAVVVATATVGAFALIQGIETWTGAPLHGAGELRRLMTQNDAITLVTEPFPIRFDPKVFYYLLAAAPFLALLTLRTAGTAPKGEPDVQGDPALVAFFGFTIVMPFLLHATAQLPNTHFSRYQLYVFLLTALYASWGSHAVPLRSAHFAALFGLSGLLLFGVENEMRGIGTDRVGTPQRMAFLAQRFSQETRKTLSDNLCKISQNCQEGRLTRVATQEVQIRMRLDDRFKVISLDGVTDYRLASYQEENGCFRQFDYLLDREADVILFFEDYAPRAVQCDQSLERVETSLSAGEIFVQGRMHVSPERVVMGVPGSDAAYLVGVLHRGMAR